MSGFFSKIWSKLIVLIIAILLIIGLRELIFTDSSIAAAFGALMGSLPFSKQITDVICRILKCQQSIPLITTSSLITDLIKLALMSVIQPIVVALFTRIFLKIPYGSSYDMEEHMNKFGYRIKELGISVLISPVIAAFVAYLTTLISYSLNNKFGGFLSTVIGILFVIVISVISTLPLIFFSGISFGKALIWRLVITLLGKMLTSIGITVCSLCLYISIISGLHQHILAFILVLLFWLIIMDIIIHAVQSLIAN